ncbi:MAG TPA: pilus assembly protein TadG-related protein [Rhodoblastus sp.]|nr:pilus assembly protein TadG-related protein [Rhodoblastus sp.]
MRRFRNDRSGAAAVFFAIALFPILLCAGAAVDYASAIRMRTTLTSSLDSAALSVAVAKSSGQNVNLADAALTQAVQKALQASLGPFAASANVAATASIDGSGALAASAQIGVPTRFMSLVGIRSINVTATTRVSMSAGPVELAMVLDTTGSMAGAKIAALQTAATSLTNTLFSVPNATSNVKMAVVPFTDYVNIGLADRNASWLTGAQDYTTPASGSCQDYPNMVCTGGYTTVNATCTNDGVSSPCSYQACNGYTQQGTYQWCPTPVTHSWYGCVGSRNYPTDVGASADVADATNPVPALLDYGCATALQRLTNNQSSIQTAINNLTASGETYIAPALLWGWRVLSPYTPYADGAAYNSRARKYLVLMTDGYNTHSPNYPDHEGTDTSTANDLTAQTCTAIKAKGITIYAVAFQVSDPTIKAILQNCATTSSGYFDSASSLDLLTAFQQIGAAITQVRIVN